MEAGEAERFARSRRACRLLTDGPGERLRPERFADCMEERGWRRRGPLERLLGGDAPTDASPESEAEAPIDPPRGGR